MHYHSPEYQLKRTAHQLLCHSFRGSTEKDLSTILKESDGLYRDLTPVIKLAEESGKKKIQDNLAHVLITMRPYIEILWRYDHPTSYQIEHDLKLLIEHHFTEKILPSSRKKEKIAPK